VASLSGSTRYSNISSAQPSDTQTSYEKVYSYITNHTLLSETLSLLNHPYVLLVPHREFLYKLHRQYKLFWLLFHKPLLHQESLHMVYNRKYYFLSTLHLHSKQDRKSS